MVIRCFGDDLAGFVHDDFHVPSPIQRAGLVDAPIDRALVQAMYLNNGTLGDGSSCMLRRTFPTKAVHRQRDLVRDMVNGDAVYPYQRTASTEEQFAAVL